jgi:predicted transcriptional regulator
LEFLQKSPHKRFELEEIHEGLNIPSSQKYSVHQALGRLFKRGLITKRPSKLGGKRKVYGCSTPQEECDTSLRKVNIDIQDTHPPVSDKVSTHLSENVDSKELQRVDSVLTRVDSVLTHQNIKHPVNTRKADGESNPDVLTNKGGEGCVSSNFCPTVTLDSRSSLPKVGERWEWMSDESPRTVVLIIEHELNNDYEVRGVDEFGYLHSITRNDVRRKFWEVRK